MLHARPQRKLINVESYRKLDYRWWDNLLTTDYRTRVYSCLHYIMLPRVLQVGVIYGNFEQYLLISGNVSTLFNSQINCEKKQAQICS